MSRRRRGSSASWYRRKAEAEAFMHDLQRRFAGSAQRYPEMIAFGRHGMSTLCFDSVWDDAVIHHGELPPGEASP